MSYFGSELDGLDSMQDVDISGLAGFSELPGQILEGMSNPVLKHS